MQHEGNTGQSGKWTGPHTLLGIKNEACYIKLESSDGITCFRSTTVKLFLQDTHTGKVKNKDNNTKDQSNNVPTTPQNPQPQVELPQTQPDVNINNDDTDSTFDSEPH